MLVYPLQFEVSSVYALRLIMLCAETLVHRLQETARGLLRRYLRMISQYIADASKVPTEELTVKAVGEQWIELACDRTRLHFPALFISDRALRKGTILHDIAD